MHRFRFKLLPKSASTSLKNRQNNTLLRDNGQSSFSPKLSYRRLWLVFLQEYSYSYEVWQLSMPFRETNFRKYEWYFTSYVDDRVVGVPIGDEILLSILIEREETLESIFWFVSCWLYELSESIFMQKIFE
jgi:hypothetical protein